MLASNVMTCRSPVQGKGQRIVLSFVGDAPQLVLAGHILIVPDVLRDTGINAAIAGSFRTGTKGCVLKTWMRAKGAD